MQEYAEVFVLHGYTNQYFLAGIKAKVCFTGIDRGFFY
jgi:hypothetical protein